MAEIGKHKPKKKKMKHAQSQKIQSSTTSKAVLPPESTKLKTKSSSSTSTLLHAEYNPHHNPKKDALVQSASIKILEVESLLDKIDHHIDKHHRKSSKKLQDFEQIHTELSKIQSSLIHDEQTSNNHSIKRIKSQIDPFIIIASSDHDDDKYDEEKDDEKHNPIETIHNNALSQLEPFQSLVSKIQKEIDPNTTSSDSDLDQKQDHNKESLPRRSSIKVKQSELHTIHDYVNQHRNKMKEKTYQYEEKKKQLLSAKERLSKAKQRFRKRLNKSKRKNRERTRSEHTKVRNVRYHKHMTPKGTAKAATTADIHSSNATVHVIKENGDDTVLSLANLSKLNADKQIKYLSSKSPVSPRTHARFAHGLAHNKSHTNSSVQSAFSIISDQSFVEDFHSITAELESIDDIVRNQVKSPSMTSIFSDLQPSPRENGGKANTKFNYTEQHIKNNTSSMSGDSDTNPKRYQSYASSEDNSLQSELFQLQDIEHQIGDL